MLLCGSCSAVSHTLVLPAIKPVQECYPAYVAGLPGPDPGFSSLVLTVRRWRMIRRDRQYWRYPCKGREAQFSGWVQSALPRKPSILESPSAVPRTHKTVPGHPDNSQRRNPPARFCRPAASYIRHIPPFYRSLRVIGVMGVMGFRILEGWIGCWKDYPQPIFAPYTSHYFYGNLSRPQTCRPIPASLFSAGIVLMIGIASYFWHFRIIKAGLSLQQR